MWGVDALKRMCQSYGFSGVLPRLSSVGWQGSRSVFPVFSAPKVDQSIFLAANPPSLPSREQCVRISCSVIASVLALGRLLGPRGHPAMVLQSFHFWSISLLLQACHSCSSVSSRFWARSCLQMDRFFFSKKSASGREGLPLGFGCRGVAKGGLEVLAG